MSAGAVHPVRVTTLECEALIEGWYRDLVDPVYLGIDLEVWLWCLHFPGRACTLNQWFDKAMEFGRSTLTCTPLTIHRAIGRLHWMSAFNRSALDSVATMNLPHTELQLRAHMPGLRDLGLVWLALARGDDELASATDAQRSLVVSARAIALVRRSEWCCEVLSERALSAVADIASDATREPSRLRCIALA